MTQKADARGTRIKYRPEFNSKPMPLTFGPDTMVKDAATAMSENRYGSVVVVDKDQKVLGIVTERDVLNKIVAKGLDPSEQKLSDVMTTKVRMANENDDLIDWLRVMPNERFRRLPIVDTEGRISAVFTQGDFVSYTWPELVFQARAMVKATAGRNFQYILIFGGIGPYALLMLLVLNTLQGALIMSKPILIMGATSGIGKCAVDEALSRGVPVRAFARSADSMARASGIETHAGDALNRDDVAGALIGTRAVIFALGIRERLAMLWEEEILFSKSTSVVLQEMENAGVSRLLAVTGFGAGRSKSALSLVERAGHKAIFGKPYEDKDRQEAMIIASQTDWTIVRPVILTKGSKSGKFHVLRKPEDWRMGLISRKDVAVYLIDAIETNSDVKSDVVLAR